MMTMTMMAAWCNRDDERTHRIPRRLNPSWRIHTAGRISASWALCPSAHLTHARTHVRVSPAVVTFVVHPLPSLHFHLPCSSPSPPSPPHTQEDLSRILLHSHQVSDIVWNKLSTTTTTTTTTIKLLLLQLQLERSTTTMTPAATVATTSNTAAAAATTTTTTTATTTTTTTTKAVNSTVGSSCRVIDCVDWPSGRMNEHVYSPNSRKTDRTEYIWMIGKGWGPIFLMLISIRTITN